MSDKTGLPKFARVEISLQDRLCIIKASERLRELADEMQSIFSSQVGNEEARILVHHQIKIASQKLRTMSEETNTIERK